MAPRILAVDTEGYRGAVWGLSICLVERKAFVVRATEPAKLSLVQWAFREADCIYMHHALHDLPILRELGFEIDASKVVDTMCLAYLLGLEPQGLKPLGYRHCGMLMREYLDLASVSEERVARTWLAQVYDRLPSPPPKVKKSKKSPLLPDVIDPMTLDLMKAHTLIGKMLEKPAPIRKRWNDCRAYEILDEQAMDVDMPVPSLDDVIADHGGDPTQVIDYVGADPDATRRLGPILEAQIDAYGLRDCFTVTNSIIPMIDRMQSVGILGDEDHFRGLIPIFEGEGRVLDLQIAEALGYAINANSPDQVQDALFVKLRLHKRLETRQIRMKRTEKGNYSTDDKALEAIDGIHPVVSLIRERREITKLLGSYVYPVLEYLKRSPDGRLRCELLLTRTDTGRLAAKRPNLLAWPKHSARGKLIRYGFRASPGKEFGAWDMSQIEMCTFADDADEWAMLNAILAGKDLHTSTAAMIFGRSYDAILDEYTNKTGKGGEQRFAAKCFHPDVEVLTRTGWKRILDLQLDEEVVQAHPYRDGDVGLSWAVPLDIHEEHRDALLHLRNEGMDLRVTPDHLMMAWRGSGEWFLDWPSVFAKRARYWANAGVLRNPSRQKLPREALLRLAVAAQADGSITPYRSLRFGFSKQRKIRRLKKLLRETKIPATVSVRGRVTTFAIKQGYASKILNLLDADKTLPWNWLNYPLRWRRVVLDEAKHWDSHQGTGWRAYRYFSVPQKNRDVLMALAAISGYKTRERGIGLTIRDRATTRSQGLKTTALDYHGPVACLSMPTGFVLVRDGGVPVIVKQSVNFGEIMGITEFGLLAQFHKNKQLHWTLDDCAKLLAEWGKAYPQGVAYQKEKHREARQFGYVRDRFGRLRWLEGVRSDDDYLRAEAERMAQATPVQSGAQGIMQRAMRDLWPVLRDVRDAWGVEPLLQTHDELLFEYNVDRREEMDLLVTSAMANAVQLKVPVTSKGSFGQNWGAIS